MMPFPWVRKLGSGRGWRRLRALLTHLLQLLLHAAFVHLVQVQHFDLSLQSLNISTGNLAILGSFQQNAYLLYPPLPRTRKGWRGWEDNGQMGLLGGLSSQAPGAWSSLGPGSWGRPCSGRWCSRYCLPREGRHKPALTMELPRDVRQEYLLGSLRGSQGESSLSPRVRESLTSRAPVSPQINSLIYSVSQSTISPSPQDPRNLPTGWGCFPFKTGTVFIFTSPSYLASPSLLGTELPASGRNSGTQNPDYTHQPALHMSSDCWGIGGSAGVPLTSFNFYCLSCCVTPQ